MPVFHYSAWLPTKTELFQTSFLFSALLIWHYLHIPSMLQVEIGANNMLTSLKQQCPANCLCSLHMKDYVLLGM